jgi:GNAT superfamily N-acetyltransferase
MAYRRLAEGAAADDDWWLVVRDASGAVVGAGMRTARFEPRPLFLLPMPDDAAVELAQALHERGEPVLAVNGALPAAHVCAQELARLTGGQAQIGQHTRLHRLGELVPPTPVAGELRAITEDEVELAAHWFEAFGADADEQAGRPRGTSAHDVPEREDILRRARGGQLWFWADDTGSPVHLTGAGPTAFGVSRIGPVYTPPEQRGRGWASNAVAEVSRRRQAEGTQVCLFTDQANPTSNGIYAALGFVPVVDMANMVIAP